MSFSFTSETSNCTLELPLLLKKDNYDDELVASRTASASELKYHFWNKVVSFNIFLWEQMLVFFGSANI